jgi:bacterial leucyl aminopeptidase
MKFMKLKGLITLKNSTQNSTQNSTLCRTTAAGAVVALALASSAAMAKPVIAEIQTLETVGAEILTQDREIGLGYANLTDEQELRISELSHKQNKCAGFEALPFGPVDGNHPLIQNVFGEIKAQNARNKNFHPSSRDFAEVQANPEITAAVNEVNADNIRATVQFLSSFTDREYRSDDPNKHIDGMKARLEALIKASSMPATVEVVGHDGISQKSIRVSIPGATHPEEIIVLGGHLDSINQSWGAAPGADDNASGSADIVEALRIVLSKKQPARTIEFYFYAGEEGGLLGSSEIARNYRNQNKNVIAVLQLDMTLFPGAGPLVLGSMTDYTSAWLRSYLETINGLYLKASITEDQCGYGCSDHASWYRQGYPTLMPFEATFRGMNHNLHTDRDVIDSRSDFQHAAIFAKIAVVMALDLGNSTLKEPK